MTSETVTLAVSLLTSQEHEVSDADVLILRRAAADGWTPVAKVSADLDVDAERVEALVHKGLLLGRGDDARLAELRGREEALAATGWDRYAALYHYMARWQGVDAYEMAGARPRRGGRGELDDRVAREGPPPPAFHRPAVAERGIDLPLAARSGPLARLLARRRTIRWFDRRRSLDLDELSTILRQVWGCHGTAEIADGVPALKKTSPSGGSLHPVEVYPLVIRVSGLEPGLYHYDVERHALDPLETVSVDEARGLASLFTAGQRYFATASALFIMTARFFRNFWKYREHSKAYKAILLDVGHLSQTFYLVNTELGLGPFFTAAINDVEIENRLAIDGIAESAMAICGCGRPLPRGYAGDLPSRPFEPRR